MDQIILRGEAVDLDRDREREAQPWKSFADNPIPSHSHSRCPGQSQNQRIIKLTDNSNTAKGFKSIWISITYEALLSSVAITSVLFILNFVYLPLFTRWSICTMREFHGCHAATYAAVPLCAFTLSFLVALLLSTLSSSNSLNEQLQEEFVQFSSNNYWTGRKPFPPGQNTDDFANNNNLKTGDGRDGDYDEGGISMRHGGGGSLKWKGQAPVYDYDIDIENASSSVKHQNTIYPQVNASKDSIRVSKFLGGEENILKNSDSNNNGAGFRFLDSTYAHFPTGAPPNSPKRKKNRKKDAELYRDRDPPQPINNASKVKVSDGEGGKKTQQCGSGNGVGPSFFHRNYIADGNNNKNRIQSESGIDCVEPPPHFYAEVEDENQDNDIVEDEKGISDEELDYLTLDELDMDDDILLSTEVKSHVGSQQNRNLGSSSVPKQKHGSKVSFLDENDRYRAYLYGYQHDSDDDFLGAFPVAASPTTPSPGKIAIGMEAENLNISRAQEIDRVRIRSQDRDRNQDRNQERTSGRRGSKVDMIPGAGTGTTSKTTLGMSSKMPCANINVINGSYNDNTLCMGWSQNQLKNDDMTNILKQNINSPTRLVSLSGLSKIPRPKPSAQFSLPPEDD